MKKQVFVVFLLLLNTTIILSQPWDKIRYDKVVVRDGSKDEVKKKWFAEISTLWDKSNSQFRVEFKEQLKGSTSLKSTLVLTQISQWKTTELRDSIPMDYCLVQSGELDKYFVAFCGGSDGTQKMMSISRYENPEKGFTLAGSSGEEIETIMHINQDGQSAFMHLVSSSTSIAYHNFTLARDFESDSIKICYTSEDVELEEKKNHLYVAFSSMNTYHSVVVKRNISRNLTFKDGIYTYKNDSIIENGKYGLGTGGEMGFKNFKYSWIIPDNIEVVSHVCNREGKWTKTANSIIFSGEDINNVLFTISYKIKNTPSKEIEKTQVSLKETVKVPNKKVSITIWDNNIEDGDMISLSLNGSWIVRNLIVSKCKTTFELNLDQKENYLIMKAENVGSNPPNTAAFLIQSKGFKKEVVLNSDLGKSEMLKIEVE